MKENTYQIFIASSLRLGEHRSVVSQAISEVNDSEEAKRSNVQFSEFIYERRPDINQKLEKHDAQAPADSALRQSSIFFLIIHDVVRDLTQYEFELAVKRFKQNQMPQHIAIFRQRNPDMADVKEGMTYDEFIRRNNLNEYVCDDTGRPVTHKKIYDIPFDSLNAGKESLKEHVKSELLRLLKSDGLPFPGAVLGSHLNKHHFFSNDILRLEKCPSVYYSRIIDGELGRAIATNKAVLLTGNSLSGKTRAVLEALKKVNDGWVYVFNRQSNDEEMVRQIKSLTSYLRRENPPKLYIAIDDIGLLARSDEQIETALEEMVSAVLEPENHGVLVATSSDSDINLSGMTAGTSGVEVLHIDDLSDDDFEKAYQYFLSCGISVAPTNFRYRMIGALFVNLDELRNRYRRYLEGKDAEGKISLLKKEVQAVRAVVRQMLLRAIKAHSIWRDDYMGYLPTLQKMTAYYVNKEYDVEATMFEEAFKNAVEALCEGGRLGVSRAGKQMIDVQEYIYKYFIDYNGELQNPTEDRDKGMRDEKDAIRDILLFCNEHLKEDPLTYQVSRLSGRCNFRQESVDWFYHLWIGDQTESADKELMALLNEDRRCCIEQMRETDLQLSKHKHHYSKIIENYIYLCCDFRQAWQAFEACEPLMRTDHLLCAVMRQAKSDENRALILQHEDYQRLKNGFYVIRAEIEWADDFASAVRAAERFTVSESPAQVAERLRNATEVQYDIVQIEGAMNTLFSKPNTEEEFDGALNLLKRHFTKLVKDRNVLQKIATNQLIVKDETLTCIDLLARINPVSVGVGIDKIYRGDVDGSQMFLHRLTSAVAPTLNGGFTSETEIRLLLSYLGSRLIRAAAETGSSFDEVYHSLFMPLRIPHPTKKDTDIIFRNSYTYTAMMLCDDCDIIKAINLFENDLVPHAADSNNPIYINRYTLNVLLKKCNKHYLKYQQKVNHFFTQLGLTRDAFSYYNLLKGGKESKMYINDCLPIVHEMSQSGVEHTTFTLTSLMDCEDVDLSVALSFLEYPADLLGDFKVNPFPGVEMSPELRSVMGKSDEAWSKVFRKHCRLQEEKDVINRCLAWLERADNRQILKNGKIYNALVTNRDYLNDIMDVVEFVRTKKRANLFTPDSYTASILVRRTSKEKDVSRKGAISELNRFFSENPMTLNDMVINNRLNTYKNFEEQLPQYFPDEAEGGMPLMYSMMGYVEKMQQMHIPITSFAIRIVTRTDMRPVPDNMLNRLIRAIIKQQEYYICNAQDSEALRERVPRSILDNYPNLKQTPMSPLSYNKGVRNDFERGNIDINEALSQLNWENENSAVTEFNTILSKYIDSFNPKTPDLFKGVMGYYNRHFGAGSSHRPSSYTFGVLVKAVSSLDDYKELMEEFKKRKANHPRLSLQPVMLSRLSAVVKNIEDLTRWTRAYINDGGETSIEAADNYLYRIAHFIVKNDPENAKPLLNDVFRFIILGGDAQQALRANEREYLLMHLYEAPSHVQAQALHTIITCNPLISNPLTVEQIVDAIGSKYRRFIPELINLLIEKNTPRTKAVFVPRLFWKLSSHSRPILSRESMTFLSKKLVRQFNIEDYNRFLAHLYTIDCRSNVEFSVPALIRCIHRMKVDEKEKAQRVRLAEAQMLIYSNLGRLRCGHLLIEKAPDEYVDWCHYALQNDVVSQLLNDEMDEAFKRDTISAKQQITYYANRLEDAFPCSLDLLRKYKETGESIDKETAQCIKDQEKRFVERIRTGEVSFNNIRRLPLSWVRTEWTPSSTLVMAMINAYANQVVYNGEHAEEAEQIIWELTEGVEKANQHGDNCVIVYFDTLGRFPSKFKRRVTLPIGQLSKALCYPLYHLLTQKTARTRDYECCNIRRLPILWVHAKWEPSTPLVLSLISAYARIVINNGNDAKEAEKVIWKLTDSLHKANQLGKKEVKLYYNQLGIFPTKSESFVTLPISQLSVALYHSVRCILSRMEQQGIKSTQEQTYGMKSVNYYYAEYMKTKKKKRD